MSTICETKGCSKKAQWAYEQECPCDSLVLNFVIFQWIAHIENISMANKIQTTTTATAYNYNVTTTTSINLQWC